MYNKYQLLTLKELAAKIRVISRNLMIEFYQNKNSQSKKTTKLLADLQVIKEIIDNRTKKQNVTS